MQQQQQQQQQQQPNCQNSRQVFIGNLPHDCTDKVVRDLFSKFGSVADVRISNKGADQTKTLPSEARVPNFGFVVFHEESSVAKCLSSQPILLEGGYRLNVEEKKSN